MKNTLFFKEINIQGFGSIVKPLLVKLDSIGLNIIQADNGEGKTTIFSALTWCLWDIPLKKTTSVVSWEHVRGENWKGTKVEVTYTNTGNDYKVVRCKEYLEKLEGKQGKNNIYVYCNGKYQNQLRGVNDVKKYIFESLGMSMDLFKASSLFPQRFKRFLDESGPDKKKILEEAFEVSYIKKSKLLAESEKAEVAVEFNKQDRIVNELQLKLVGVKENINNLQELIDITEKNNAQKKGDFKRELKILRKELVRIKATIKEYDAKILLLEALTAKEQKYKDKVSRKDALEHQIKMVERGITTYELGVENTKEKIKSLKEELKNSPTKCSKCGKPYTEKEKEKEKKVILKTIRDEQETLATHKQVVRDKKLELLGLSEELSSINKYKQKLSTILANKEILENTWEFALKAKDNKTVILEQIRVIKSKIKEKAEDTEALIQKRTEYETTALAIENTLKLEKIALHRLSNKLEDLIWAIKDPLSNSGIKALIFDILLRKVNTALLYYTQFLGHTVKLEVNMESANKDIEVFIYQKDWVIDINDFSGGQRQLVDIAINFAINDVISDTRGCNLLILDEVFDGLSANNIDLVSEIIIARNKDKSIWLVTHRKEFNPVNARYLKLGYKKGRTFIKDYGY